MPRYDAAVRTPIVFGTGWPEPVLAELVTLRFENREFTWHANSEVNEHSGMLDSPTVTVMIEGVSDGMPEALATNRLLSAMSWRYRVPFEVLNTTLSGFPGPTDRAVARAGGVHHWAARRLVEPPEEIRVSDDPGLRLVLGLAREGMATESPYYRFLAYWNALEAALPDHSDLDAFLASASRRWYHLFFEPTPEKGWALYMRDSNRNAVAHAIRRSPDLPMLDPDDPADRARLMRDSRLLRDLLDRQVDGRWPLGVVA